MVMALLPWLTVQLGDVVPYGKTEKCELFDVSGDTWILELEDIEKDSSKIIQRLDANARPFKSTKNKFRKGDVLYGKLRPYLNKVVIADRSGVCSTEIIPLNAEPYIDNRYLFYWLKSEMFLDFVNSVSYGVNMPRLGTKDGLVAPFVVAPLAEQKVIADKLDTMLAQVEATKSRLERIPNALKIFRQSVLAAAVSGKLTEEWRRKNDISIKNWLSTNVGDLAEVATGKTPKRANSEYWEGGTVPWLTSAATGSAFTIEAEQFVTELAVKECSLKMFPIGTLLLAMYGEGKTRGQVTEIQLAATCNQACAAIIVDETKISKEFLKICLQENYEETRKAAAGGAQPNLNLNKVREIPIELPSKLEQRTIVQRVEELFTFADSVEQKAGAALAHVNNLTQSILAKAFRGEFTNNWRAANPDLINGENSAKALLEKIKAEREVIKRQPKPKRPTAKEKTNNHMSKQIIKVVEALKQAGEPLSGQQLLAATGYPSDSNTDQLEQFFLDIRDALSVEKSIVKLERDDGGQDWFALAQAATNE